MFINTNMFKVKKENIVRRQGASNLILAMSFE